MVIFGVTQSGVTLSGRKIRSDPSATGVNALIKGTVHSIIFGLSCRNGKTITKTGALATPGTDPVPHSETTGSTTFINQSKLISDNGSGIYSETATTVS